VHALAKHNKVDVPDDVERFFEAVEGGRWEEIDAAHKALLLGGDLTTPRSAELHQIWRAIQETWGIAREAHDWPAQKLLDYGEAVLGSLRPGMIYVGGTDPGCFIPTFLNETAEGEHHIVLTQNALADGTYLDYLNFLYGDRLATLTQDDSQRAFQEYLADAQRRLEHDRRFPNEQRQIKPGEDVKIVESRVQVSGQVAVMAINGLLTKIIFDKNPDHAFYVEESFPLDWMYPYETPYGIIMKINRDPVPELTEEIVQRDHKFWSDYSERLVGNWITYDTTVSNICAFAEKTYHHRDFKGFKGDPRFVRDNDGQKAFSKLRSSIAGLYNWWLDPRNGKSPDSQRRALREAEFAFKQAYAFCPYSPEAVFRYINLLWSDLNHT